MTHHLNDLLITSYGMVSAVIRHDCSLSNHQKMRNTLKSETYKIHQQHGSVVYMVLISYKIRQNLRFKFTDRLFSLIAIPSSFPTPHFFFRVFDMIFTILLLLVVFFYLGFQFALYKSSILLNLLSNTISLTYYVYAIFCTNWRVNFSFVPSFAAQSRSQLVCSN